MLEDDLDSFWGSISGDVFFGTNVILFGSKIWKMYSFC